jgi:hypothetical protein
MERAEARKLQPHFIADFFLTAFKTLGGTFTEKEKGRYQVIYVPSAIRNRDRIIGTREPILKSYERITFHKELINVQEKPIAAFVCPGHPLLEAVIDLILESHLTYLKQGAVLIDEQEPLSNPRILYYIENSIQDAKQTENKTKRIISKEIQFLELDEQETITMAGYAPYLNYRPATTDEVEILKNKFNGSNWLAKNIEETVKSYAIQTLCKDHLDRVKKRLTNEIKYWDCRARDLKLQEEAGKPNAKLNSNEARKRADDLQGRLQKRLQELDEELKISSRPPVLIGGALVIPSSYLDEDKSESYKDQGFATPEEKTITEKAAMDAVYQLERELKNNPRDRSKEKIGYDIESTSDESGSLRFIEVKGRKKDAKTVTITKNEIIYGLNLPDQFILALAFVDGKEVDVNYVKAVFRFEPDFGVTSVNFNVKDLLTKTFLRKTIILS